MHIVVEYYLLKYTPFRNILCSFYTRGYSLRLHKNRNNVTLDLPDYCKLSKYCAEYPSHCVSSTKKRPYLYGTSSQTRPTVVESILFCFGSRTPPKLMSEADIERKVLWGKENIFILIYLDCSSPKYFPWYPISICGATGGHVNCLRLLPAP